MTLTGKIIEIGELEHLATGEDFSGWKSGIVILVPREQLQDMTKNLLYCEVKIKLVKIK